MPALVLLWICASVLAGYVAGEKHRSGLKWVLLSLLFSPLVALLALAALPVGED